MPRAPMALLRHDFTLAGGTQTASFGLWFTWGTVPATGDMQAWVDGPVRDNWNANMNAAVLGIITSQDTFAGWTAYGYDASGVLVDEGQHPVSLPGSGTPGGYPQIAMVATLRTPGYGRAFRGRIYLPYTRAGDTERLRNADVDAITTGLGTYLSTFLLAGRPPVVWSRSRADAYSVIRVTVDNVADTQRRRRDKVASTHESSAAVTPD